MKDLTTQERIDLYLDFMPYKYCTGDLFDFLVDQKFFEAPASTKYHGAYPGGLFDHSFRVAIKLQEMTTQMGLEWEREFSPYIIGMFHDLCKIDRYTIAGYETECSDCASSYWNAPPKYEYVQNELYSEHGAKSIFLLSQFMTLSPDEIACIRYHMGAYYTEEWNQFDKAIRLFPNVIWTHSADMYASKVLDI